MLSDNSARIEYPAVIYAKHLLFWYKIIILQVTFKQILKMAVAGNYIGAGMYEKICADINLPKYVKKDELCRRRYGCFPCHN